MPPKGRGSTRGRGRGRGRGGATASPSTAAGATPQSIESAVASEASAPAQPTSPKQEDDGDAKPPTTSENTPAPAESQQSPSTTAYAITSPQDGANSTARPPVQRLGSLNPSRSASPATRGRGNSTRSKRGTVKPTFTGRRSKEERAALEKEALEREKERTREREKAEKWKRQDAEKKAKREADRAARGRGGYSGAMSGPFSLGSSREDRKTTQRTASTFGSGTGSRATRVKHERDRDDAAPSYRSNLGGGTSIKREIDGLESSDDEEDPEFPRKDIDLIEISSDENEVRSAERSQRATLPVRIGRKQHQERTFGINTEASTETSAQALEEVDATCEKPGIGVLKQPSSKGKSKAKDVATTTAKKPFKGVWQDPDDLTTDHVSDRGNMGDAEQVGIMDAPLQAAEDQEPSPDTERRFKARIKGITEPVLQTDEDHAEWARFQSNRKHIRAELGPEELAAVDGSSDVNMEDAAVNTKKTTVRDNNVYLFQIPPLTPELSLSGIKKEPSDAQSEPVALAPVPLANSEVKIKVEEGFSEASSKGTEASPFASGCVGKVRVRKSGRTTFDWGGISYELNPGNKVSFLQEVVKIQVVPEKDRVVPEDAGEATSFGRVKGKFVVVPDWSRMLG